MATLTDDLRQLIEHDQSLARPLLTDLAARLPNSAEARALLAQSYLRSLELDPALEHYTAAHELDPKNLGIRHQMGLSAIAKGDYEAALRIFQDARQIAPAEHSDAMAALLLHRLGRLADSAKAYQSARDGVSVWWDYNLKLATENQKSSEATYRRALQVLASSTGAAIMLTIVIWPPPTSCASRAIRSTSMTVTTAPVG